MSINKILRRFALICLIVLASMLPVPMIIYRKDKLPKHLIEQFDTNDDEDDNDETKSLF